MEKYRCGKSKLQIEASHVGIATFLKMHFGGKEWSGK